MTSTVRIEKADNTSHSIIIELWERYPDSEDYLVDTHVLEYPAQLHEVNLWAGRYLVVKEA